MHDVNCTDNCRRQKINHRGFHNEKNITIGDKRQKVLIHFSQFLFSRYYLIDEIVTNE